MQKKKKLKKKELIILGFQVFAERDPQAGDLNLDWKERTEMGLLKF